MMRIFSRYLLQEVGFWILVLTGVVLLVFVFIHLFLTQ